MNKFLKYIFVFLVVILTACGGGDAGAGGDGGEGGKEIFQPGIPQLEIPEFSFKENGKILFEKHKNTDYFEVTVNGELYGVYYLRDEIYVKSGDVVKIRAISNDENLYKNSEYVEKEFTGKKLNPPIFRIDEFGYVYVEPVEGVDTIGIVLNNDNEFFYEIHIPFLLADGDTIKIRYIGNSDFGQLDSEYSEPQTYNKPKIVIDVPSFIVEDNLKMYINHHNQTTLFGVVINNQKEVEKSSSDVIELKYGDVVKVRAILHVEGEILYSEYTEEYKVEGTLNLPKLKIDFDPNSKEKILLNNVYVVDTLWVEWNGEIFESTVYDFYKFDYKINDKIRLKFRSENPHYIESEEWSNYITYYEGDPDIVNSLELSNEKNKVKELKDNGDGTLSTTVTTSTGEVIDVIITGTAKISENGWLVLGPNSTIDFNKNLDGLYLIESGTNTNSLTPLENKIEIRLGIDYENLDVITKFDEIEYGGFMMFEINGKPHSDGYLSENANHFKIINSNDSDFDITDLVIWYTGCKNKVINLEWNYDFFTTYIPHEKYSIVRESNSLDYYLLIDTYNEYFGVTNTHYHTKTYEVINLKDSKGNIVSKDSRVDVGYVVEMKVGGYVEELEIVSPIGDNFKTNHDLVKYAYPEAIGSINNIVVPIYWKDQQDRNTDINYESLLKVLGNIIDEKGNVLNTSKNDDDFISLSEYFYQSSYGKLTVNSFVTKWYYLDENLSDNYWSDFSSREDLEEKIIDWVLEQYPDIDISLFDKDKNAIYDSIIFINTADLEGYDSYNRTGFTGAYHYRKQYTNEFANTLEEPGINTYINISFGFLFDDYKIDDGVTGLMASTLIHEYGHTLGLVDYYDTIGSFSPVGKFDMQDSNCGDWNPYSKYSVGWITPNVIDEEDFNGKTSIDIRIDAFAESGDVLLIPALGYDYNGTPFDEYIMLELFTPSGLYNYVASDFGLNNTIGVRMYHVDARHEMRTLTNKEGESFQIGTIHYSNSTGYNSNEYGYFLIETIQADKVNTLTSTNVFGNSIESNDFFKQGDTFKMNEYKEFFYEGLMDSGFEFGYTITIKEINTGENPYAIITISK